MPREVRCSCGLPHHVKSTDTDLKGRSMTIWGLLEPDGKLIVYREDKSQLLPIFEDKDA